MWTSFNSSPGLALKIIDEDLCLYREDVLDETCFKYHQLQQHVTVCRFCTKNIDLEVRKTNIHFLWDSWFSHE